MFSSRRQTYRTMTYILMKVPETMFLAYHKGGNGIMTTSGRIRHRIWPYIHRLNDHDSYCTARLCTGDFTCKGTRATFHQNNLVHTSVQHVGTIYIYIICMLYSHVNLSYTCLCLEYSHHEYPIHADIYIYRCINSPDTYGYNKTRVHIFIYIRRRLRNLYLALDHIHIRKWRRAVERFSDHDV